MGIKVFVDANIFKYAAANLRRFSPYKKSINWGGVEIETTVNDIVYINPNLSINNNDKLLEETRLIPKIVALQEDKNIEFCITSELMLEVMGLPNMDSSDGLLFGAKITYIEPPVKYSRILISHNLNTKEEQYSFLRGLKSKRFLEIQKATGAYQGENAPNPNQLLDSYHLWCAEHSKCNVFLTGEAKKLNNSINGKNNFSCDVKIASLSDLIGIIEKIN